MKIEFEIDGNQISGQPRKLINGKNVASYANPIDLVVHTKAPEKWKLVDLETGEEYMGSPEPNEYGLWVRTKDKNGKDSRNSFNWSDDDFKPFYWDED